MRYLVLLAFLIGTVDFSVADEPCDESLLKEINWINGNFSAYLVNGDETGAASVFVKDGKHFRWGTEPSLSKTAIKEKYKVVFQNRDFVRREETVDKCNKVGIQVYVSGTAKRWDTTDENADPVIVVKFERLYAKESGKWRISVNILVLDFIPNDPPETCDMETRINEFNNEFSTKLMEADAVGLMNLFAAHGMAFRVGSGRMPSLGKNAIKESAEDLFESQTYVNHKITVYGCGAQVVGVDDEGRDIKMAYAWGYEERLKDGIPASRRFERAYEVKVDEDGEDKLRIAVFNMYY